MHMPCMLAAWYLMPPPTHTHTHADDGIAPTELMPTKRETAWANKRHYEAVRGPEVRWGAGESSAGTGAHMSHGVV